jgi:hypothetical protein
MDWIKGLFAQFFGPSLIGQFVRGLMKVVSGFLIGMGISDEVVGNFTSSTTEIIIALVLALLAQGASAVATKKAVETPVIVKK